MSKLKHTPAPWAAFKSELGICVTTDNSPLGVPETPLICLISDQNSFNAEDKANTRLIAAAPEMLDGLIQIYKTLKINSMDINGLRGIIERATGLSIEEVLDDK
jgi:hypothetical protein